MTVAYAGTPPAPKPAAEANSSAITFHYPAGPRDYLWKTVECDEADEPDIDALFDTYLHLLQGRVLEPKMDQAPAREISFPAAKAIVDGDYVAASLVFYITPYTMRGFEIRFPKNAVELKGRRYVLKQRLVLAEQEFKTEVHYLVLKQADQR